MFEIIMFLMLGAFFYVLYKFGKALSDELNTVEN